MVWADIGDWESRWELERNSFFPCKIKYCQLERQSVHGGKYLWEGREWAQRCWAWSEQSVKRIISFPWCSPNGDKALSFTNARTTSQRKRPLLLPSANSWQIFHFLLFIVFTKSPYSWWSRCKWKVKACDTENHVSLSAKRCDKAFPSFNMHKGSGRAISRALGRGVLQGFPGKCGEATWGCWAFCQHQSLCVSWRNAVDALEFNLINADNTVSLTYHKRAEVAHLNSLISCFSSCTCLSWEGNGNHEFPCMPWPIPAATTVPELGICAGGLLCWDSVCLHLPILQGTALCVFAWDIRIWKIADHRSSP